MNKRIYIVGVSTSGKTTLAKNLAKKIKCKHYDLDDFYFKKKYDEVRNKEEIEKLVKKTIKKKKWVIEGSYSGSNWVQEIANKADIFIWLNQSAHILTWRIIKRSFTRPKPHPKHSRVKEIFGLLKFLKDYKIGKPGKIHKALAETHPKGYILRTNKQIDKFLDDF